MPLDMNRVSTTPAALHLFNLDDSAEKLSEEKAQIFHHLVAKLLYLSCRSRQDIQMGVASLCTKTGDRLLQAASAHNEEPMWKQSVG